MAYYLLNFLCPLLYILSFSKSSGTSDFNPLTISPSFSSWPQNTLMAAERAFIVRRADTFLYKTFLGGFYEAFCFGCACVASSVSFSPAYRAAGCPFLCGCFGFSKSLGRGRRACHCLQRPPLWG